MSRPLLVAIALVAPALAGCIADLAEDGPAATAAPPAAAAALVAHAADRVVGLPSSFASLASRILPTGYLGGEPTIGVTSDGSVFVTASGGRADASTPQANFGGRILRSDDGGTTWAEKQDIVIGPKASLDPWMWVDPATDRLFHGPLYVVCSWLAWSDDKGDSWDANPVAGCGVPGHDHQKITAGPPAESVTMDGYESVIYYAYNSFRDEGTWVSASYDGGRTFSIGGVAHAPGCFSGVAGPVGSAPDGTAYIAQMKCDGVAIAVSRDSAATWEEAVVITDAGAGVQNNFDPEVAVDTEGNAYVTFAGDDGLTRVAVSTDQGATWGLPHRITPPGVTSTAFGVISAGAPGRIAVAYHATDADTSKWDDGPTDPSYATPETVWHLYLTMSENALDADPTWVTLRVTPADDPVQMGCIWLHGGVNDCRNLTDFIEMVQHEGRPYIVYSDGCDRCESASQSRTREVTVVLLESGPSLLGGALGAVPVPAPAAATGSAFGAALLSTVGPQA